MEIAVIGFLVGLICIREVTHHLTLHRLINKLMSRNFYEYQQGISLPEAEKKRAQDVAKLDMSLYEDASSIRNSMGI